MKGKSLTGQQQQGPIVIIHIDTDNARRTQVQTGDGGGRAVGSRGAENAVVPGVRDKVHDFYLVCVFANALRTVRTRDLGSIDHSALGNPYPGSGGGE